MMSVVLMLSFAVPIALALATLTNVPAAQNAQAKVVSRRGS
jgi:hypothetical protein